MIEEEKLNATAIEVEETQGPDGVRATEGEGAPGDVKRGDYVLAEWSTPGGTEKWVRGEVAYLKGSSVWVVYYYEHSDGGLCHYGIKTIRRNKNEVRRTSRLPNELRPHEYLDWRIGSKEFPGALMIHQALREATARHNASLRARLPELEPADG